MSVSDAVHRDLQLRNLASISQVRALSQWTEWLVLLRADSDEPLCMQFHRASMPSRGIVVHGISHYIVGVAVARTYVSKPGASQRIHVTQNAS